jgi:sugar lactone lactonase YvrE
VALWKDKVVYVANTLRGLVVSIPILEDGSAGEATLIAGDNSNGCEFDELFGLDGIALDVHGSIYALSVIQNKLIRIDPSAGNGSYELLLDDNDGLFNPSSIAFGTGKGDRQSVFIVNFGLFFFEEPAASLGPAVLKFDVGVPGLPLP